MSATSRPRRVPRRTPQRPRDADPRVVRTVAAALDAARACFLEKGYARTTMDEIAVAAGLTKRTLYNNFADKEVLFRRIVSDAVAYAERFARGLAGDFARIPAPAESRAFLHELGERLALGVVRPEIVTLRRLLIGEAREFPDLARDYYERAPGAVIAAIATGFRKWMRAGVLRPGDARVMAVQFAYLVIGGALDRATLCMELPSAARLRAQAKAGVETFLAAHTVV